MISIVIPVYNAEKYIQRSIECVVNQTYKDWELLLVDDGSTDSSLSICESYSKRYPNIYCMTQNNTGPSAARNNGLGHAQGDYVAFIDADDWFDADLLSDYAKAIERQQYDVVFQGFVREFDNGSRVEPSFAMSIDTNSASKKDIICRLYKNRVFGWSWCKVFRKEVIDRYQLAFDESLRLWEDELFTINFLKHAESIRTLDCHHYHYIQYEGSLMNTNNTYLRRLALSEIMNDNLKELANEELSDYINDNYNKKLKYSLLMALMNKSDHLCSSAKKRELLRKYYDRCSEFPSLKRYNALKSMSSYYIAETILMTHCKAFVELFFSKLG